MNDRNIILAHKTQALVRGLLRVGMDTLTSLNPSKLTPRDLTYLADAAQTIARVGREYQEVGRRRALAGQATPGKAKQGTTSRAVRDAVHSLRQVGQSKQAGQAGVEGG